MKIRGFTLLELMVGLLVLSVTVTGLVALASSSTQAWRLQRNLSQMHESARYAMDTISHHVESAGFHHEPWASPGREAILAEAKDSYGIHSDLLALTRRSRSNCVGNDNPERDVSGAPRADLLQVTFWKSATNSLVMRCRYGPDEENLVTQLNNFSLVDHVAAFQALYAEDLDQDGLADRWATPATWSEETRVLGVRVGLLLRTPESVSGAEGGTFQVLNESINTPADGRHYRVYESTMAIRGRT